MGLSKYSVIESDVIEWANQYDGPEFHALLCDPPYHLVSITKRFGKVGSKPAQAGPYNRTAKGFMQTDWDGLGQDGRGIAFQPETWAVLAQHLYPGGFGMAFASSRGWHRMAVAIEDAGLIIHPTVWLWVQGQGFPKATRIPDDRFSGHRYGGQAMKPAVEPIILFQKPYTGRPVDCITETGAGALNIDAARIPSGEDYQEAGFGPRYGASSMPQMGGHQTRPCVQEAIANGQPVKNSQPSPYGRWPSNLLLHHNSTCSPNECAAGCPVERLGEMSGERPGGGSKTGLEPSDLTKNVYRERNRVAFPGYDDKGTAARFFFQGDWSYEVLEQLSQADPIQYVAKASRTEREAGLEDLPTKTRHRVNSGGLENEPRFTPVQVKNDHPTIKSISLTKYLASLLLPPEEYKPRRILVPFAGTGSEMIGALLAGWDEVIGIEMKPEYVEIAEARLAWWSEWLKYGQTDVDIILSTLANKPEGTGEFEQIKMF